MRAAGIRAGEGRILALVASLFAALEAGRGFGEVGLDTLVVSRFGTGTLPYLYIGLGATSLVAALGYGAAEVPAGINFLVDSTKAFERVHEATDADSYSAAFERGKRMSLDEALDLVESTAPAA